MNVMAAHQKRGQFFHLFALIQCRFIAFLITMFFKTLIIKYLLKKTQTNKFHNSVNYFCKNRGFSINPPKFNIPGSKEQGNPKGGGKPFQQMARLPIYPAIP